MLRFLLCAALVAVFSAGRTLGSGAEGEVVFDDLDAVVIEAAVLGRQSRQFHWDPTAFPFQIQNSCKSSEGRSGRCVSLKSCYPLLRFRYDLPSWALGVKDTCATTDIAGTKSVYGVCCTTKQFQGWGQQQAAWGQPQSPWQQQQQQQPAWGQQQQWGGQPGGGVQSPQYPGLQAPTHPPNHTPATHPPNHTPATHPPSFTTAAAPVHPQTEATTRQPTTATTTRRTTPTTTQWVPKPATTTTTTTTTTTATTTTERAAQSGGGGGSGCGVGRNYPIRYNTDGEDEEARERISGEHPLRVVNGWPADKNEWPWIASIMNNGRHFCGGSLISDRHILTAAHCVSHMTPQDVARLSVRLGDHNIRTSGETRIFESKASRVVRHKGFSMDTLHWDVSIITLANPLPASYSNTIRPVCIPEGNERYVGSLATVVGWGSLKEGGPVPDVLQELTMEVWKEQDCKQTYGSHAPGGITSHMMCAGHKGKDSCNGDSGGPFVVGKGPVWYQIGIVSWGIGCGKAHFPGVYTRVTEVRDWIRKVQAKF